jgi:hypothetical protein
MTARQVYEGVLIELNKVQAPSLLLEDFNYLFNKAIYQYINKKYNIYDVNQQTTDDVRVLKSTAILKPIGTLGSIDEHNTGNNAYGKKTQGVTSLNSLYGATYEFELPTDYLHLLNCICNFRVKKQFKCYDAGTYVQFGAKRLTADAWSQIINNFYMRPQYKRPYYYIHNVNKNSNVPTDPFSTEDYNTWDNGMYDISVCDTNENVKTNVGNQGDGTDVTNLDVEPGCPIYGDPEDPTKITGYSYTNTFAGGGPTDNENAEALKDIIKDKSNRENAGTIRLKPQDGDFDTNPVEKVGKVRYGNASKVRLEIRYGKDNSLFELTNIWVDYIKSPQYIRLTQEQLDLTEDTSQKMEFPDYVCQEIINELVHIVMENSSDPRMQTHPAFS